MAEIVVTELRPADRERWAELWRGYLDFYETTLPEAIYDETWRRLHRGHARMAAVFRRHRFRVWPRRRGRNHRTPNTVRGWV